MAAGVAHNTQSSSVPAVPVADPTLEVAASLSFGAPRPSEVIAADLDAWIARSVPSSPLRGYGAVFVAEAERNGINPRLLVAVASQESVLGTLGPGARVNNAFGWGPHIPFPSWRENIRVVAQGLGRYYLAEGRTTIASIAAKWAPIGVANDPGNLNAHWVEGVSQFYRSLGGDPASSVVVRAV